VNTLATVLCLWFLVAFLVWRRFRKHRGMFEGEWLVPAAYWLVVFAGIVVAMLLELWVNRTAK
jgi:hypothetical protein